MNNYAAVIVALDACGVPLYLETKREWVVTKPSEPFAKSVLPAGRHRVHLRHVSANGTLVPWLVSDEYGTGCSVGYWLSWSGESWGDYEVKVTTNRN